MSSIKKRIAELEVAKTKTEQRTMTDVEMAVRIVCILNGPDSPTRARLQEFFRPADVKCQRRGARACPI